MSEKRFLHSKATALCSLSLLHQYKETLDHTLCFQAGLLHDIAREWKDEQLLLYAKAHLLSLEREEEGSPILLHAPVGSHLLEQRGYDSSLCLAVRYHTLGSRTMGRLGLVLFIADYIEEGRTHLTDRTREALRSQPTLEMVCLEILKMQEGYLMSKGKGLARCTEDLMRFLLAGGLL